MAVNALNLSGFITHLYLDDRILTLNAEVDFKPNHTFLGAALLMCLLTGFGGYVNAKKSILVPSQIMEFLGLCLNSKTKEVSVPMEKYDKAMARMDQLWDPDTDRMCIKTLEKLRGQFCSWIVCVPIMRLMIRQMNDIIRVAYKTGNWNWTRKQIEATDLQDELDGWRNLKLFSLKRHWYEEKHAVFQFKAKNSRAFYSDASKNKMAAIDRCNNMEI